MQWLGLMCFTGSAGIWNETTGNSKTPVAAVEYSYPMKPVAIPALCAKKNPGLRASYGTNRMNDNLPGYKLA